MTTPLRGLTWDHPRGYRVLEALSRLDEAGPPNPYGAVRRPVQWSRQPLAGFEATPLRQLAEDFDLLVVDHPGIGEAVADGALMPLEELLSSRELNAWQHDMIGATSTSYRWSDQQWAVPIDAATQVGVARTGSIATVPRTWDESLALAGNTPTVLCLGGPHALLMLCAIVCALGAPPRADGRPFLQPAAGREALTVMQALFASAERELSLKDPVTVLDAMAGDAGPVYCPLVFGYVSYQRLDRATHQLTAFDAPAAEVGGRRGSVLGGTGFAVSRFTIDPAATTEHIRRLTTERVQRTLYAEEGGQAAHNSAWNDPDIDRRFCGFYSATRATLMDAWVRPRFAGFIDFQRDASAIIRGGMLAAADPEAILKRIEFRFAEVARPGAEGRTA